MRGDDISIMLGTSFIVAYHDKRDKNHDAAARIVRGIEAGEYGSAYLSEWAFDETATILKKYLGAKEAAQRGDILLASSEIIWARQEIIDPAWALFKKHAGLSFSDCYQIAAMRQLDISKVATFDSDFEGIVKVIR